MRMQDEAGKDPTICSGTYLAMLKYLKFSLYNLENDLSLHEKNQKHQLYNYRTTIKLHSNSNR